MNTKERLIELIQSAVGGCARHWAELIADKLLANGVMVKCATPNVTIKPNGVHELDACTYEVIEEYRNVTVEVLRCKRCGNVEVFWSRQEDTERLT